MPILYSPENQVFHLQNDRISYIIRLVAGKYPIHQYWGKKVRAIHADVMERCCNQQEEGFTLHELPLDTLPQECPVFGCGDMRQGMLEVRQADGSSALDLCYDSHEILKGKPALKGLPSARGEEAETLVLRLRDEHSGVAVELSYSVYPDIDVIARNMRVVNDGEQPVVLERALSACVDLENTHAQLTTLSGAWARERQMVTRPLVPGHQGVESVRGASSHQACPFMALGKSTVTEDEGEVYALSLCYSGSFWADVFVDCNDMARAQIGIQPFQFSWELKPGDSFQTPEAYLCYSANGLNGMSREFHHLCGRYITRGKYAHASRPLLVNNWEATYFDFNEDKLLELAACAKRCGHRPVCAGRRLVRPSGRGQLLSGRLGGRPAQAAQRAAGPVRQDPWAGAEIRPVVRAGDDLSRQRSVPCSSRLVHPHSRPDAGGEPPSAGAGPEPQGSAGVHHRRGQRRHGAAAMWTTSSGT